MEGPQIPPYGLHIPMSLTAKRSNSTNALPIDQQKPPALVHSKESSEASGQKFLQEMLTAIPAPKGNALSRALEFARENPAQAAKKAVLETLKLPFRIASVGIGITLAITGAVVAAVLATVVGGITSFAMAANPLWCLCVPTFSPDIFLNQIQMASQLGTEISFLAGACIGLSVSNREFGQKVAGVLYEVDRAAAAVGGAVGFVPGFAAGVGVDILPGFLYLLSRFYT